MAGACVPSPSPSSSKALASDRRAKFVWSGDLSTHCAKPEACAGVGFVLSRLELPWHRRRLFNARHVAPFWTKKFRRHDGNIMAEKLAANLGAKNLTQQARHSITQLPLDVGEGAQLVVPIWNGLKASEFLPRKPPGLPMEGADCRSWLSS